MMNEVLSQLVNMSQGSVTRNAHIHKLIHCGIKSVCCADEQLIKNLDGGS